MRARLREVKEEVFAGGGRNSLLASGVAKQAGNWFLQELMEQRVAFGVRG